MKKRYIILIIVGVVFIAGFFIIRGLVNSNEAALNALDTSHVNLAGAKDGIYTGSTNVFPVSAEVSVTIENETIMSIELLEHDHGKGAAAEVLPSRVVEAQSVDIDAVSGATGSSNVILEAIETALQKAAATAN